MYILGERVVGKRERGIIERGKIRGKYKALGAMYTKNVHIIRTVIGDVID